MPHSESVLPLGVPIAPTEPTDPNPTHIAEYGRGGLMSVADLTARGNISSDRKTAGMLVYVQSEAKYYTLTTLPNTWTELATGGGGGGAVTSVTGTANEVTVSPTTGAVVVGLPDDITVRDLNAEHVKFDTTPTVTTAAQADMVWTDNQSTVSVGMSSTVSAALGQTVYKRGKNVSGAPIAKGKVVYITGGTGSADLTFGLATNATEAGSSAAIGFAAETIADNAHGFVICTGILTGIDTSAFPMNEGEAMYLGTAGNVLASLPTQPAHGVFCGWLVKKGSGSAGVLYAKFDNYQELEELSDVLVGTTGGGIALAANQTIAYDGSVWRNVPISRVTVHEYDTDVSTLTLDSNCKFIIVEMIGGGASGTSGTASVSGAGGSAGQYVQACIPASIIVNPLSITPAATQTVPGTAGNNSVLSMGSSGSVVTLISAQGGRASTNNAAPSGSSTVGVNSTAIYGAGGPGRQSSNQSGGSGVRGGLAAGGGGGGANESAFGGHGGLAGDLSVLASASLFPNVGGGPAGGNNSAGSDSTAAFDSRGFGSGGGGGSSTVGGTGFNGGHGRRGSGGGGGGRGSPAGTGGNGGGGFIRIIQVRAQ